MQPHPETCHASMEIPSGCGYTSIAMLLTNLSYSYSYMMMVLLTSVVVDIAITRYVYMLLTDGAAHIRRSTALLYFATTYGGTIDT
eukprot:144871-Pleurochrysis_carterae.AAC.1